VKKEIESQEREREQVVMMIKEMMIEYLEGTRNTFDPVGTSTRTHAVKMPESLKGIICHKNDIPLTSPFRNHITDLIRSDIDNGMNLGTVDCSKLLDELFTRMRPATSAMLVVRLTDERIDRCVRSRKRFDLGDDTGKTTVGLGGHLGIQHDVEINHHANFRLPASVKELVLWLATSLMSFVADGLAHMSNAIRDESRNQGLGCFLGRPDGRLDLGSVFLIADVIVLHGTQRELTNAAIDLTTEDKEECALLISRFGHAVGENSRCNDGKKTNRNQVNRRRKLGLCNVPTKKRVNLIVVNQLTTCRLIAGANTQDETRLLAVKNDILLLRRNASRSFSHRLDDLFQLSTLEHDHAKRTTASTATAMAAATATTTTAATAVTLIRTVGATATTALTTTSRHPY